VSGTLKAAQRAARKQAAEDAVALFRQLCYRFGIPVPETEFKFCERFWRFDFAWPEHKVALEVDGGIWLKGGGRHTRGAGWLKDTEKLNTAASLGWRLLRTTPTGLHDLATIALIKRTITPLP
jgi:very-short-patch-repair endonuclease